MSSIINPTTPSSSSPQIDGGLIIVGFEDQVNRLQGSEESDLITSGNLDDILSGLDDKDTIEGLGGDDTIFGGDDDDELRGGTGNDSLEGNAGNDLIEGGAGRDILIGAEGNDTLISGNTFDTLDGGAGQDRLVASGESNVLDGGSGADVLILDSAIGSTVTGGVGRDDFQLDFRDLVAEIEQSIINEELPAGEEPVVPQDLSNVEVFGSLEELGAAIAEITDFQPGADQIKVLGLGGNEAPIYNQDTGILSLDDVEIVQLTTNLNIEAEDIEIAGNSNPLSVVDNSEATLRRFLNTSTGAHFYTANEAEIEALSNLPNYNSEGASYTSANPTTGAQEVYRFFDPTTGAYLYTIDKGERDSILDNLSNFTFEGVKFYAYETEVAGSIPVYRFLETSLGIYFYTPNEIEKDFIQNLDNYNFEGVAYYALPIEES